MEDRTQVQVIQKPLAHKLVGDIRGNFFVPSYQRGYRWDTDDVKRLLDDILKSGGQSYSLQPVVIKRRNKIDTEQGQEWELIDGQQRLTTLYLIFFYMQKQGWKKTGPRYAICYETRPDSAQYLSTLDPKLRDKNIDYFHLYQAYECIGVWFQNHGDDNTQEDVAETFHRYMRESVHVIWYEAPDNPDDNEKDSAALFTRLNMGRIQLTDAELVKASLFSAVRKTHPERVFELAAQWDSIERDLRDPDIWAFVTGLDASRDVDQYPTHISLLLDTLADAEGKLKSGEKHPRYYTFETLHKQLEADKTKFKFWDKVVELHALILGWFGEPSLYNKIGFLVATGTPFRTLVDLAIGKIKKDFDKELTASIGACVDIYQSELAGLSYLGNQKKLAKLLLLMNVETTSRTGQRFPFRRHIGKTWSLEHIHAQNSEGLKTVDQWRSWLVSHRDALQTLKGQHDALTQEITAALDGMAAASNFGETFSRLFDKVVKVFDQPEGGLNGYASSGVSHNMHAITNLALLSSGDNSALSNAVFEVKRQIVLGIDRNLDGKGDGYIPICTRNVFLKYHTGADALQIHLWSLQDRQSYFNAIVSVLQSYFKPETKETSQ